MSSRPYALNAKFSILPERREEFLKIIKEDQTQTLATEPGALRFVVGEDAKESNTFYLHEEYTSEEAFEAHGKTPHFEPWDKFTKTSPWSEGGEPVAGFFFGSHEQGKTEEVRSGHCVNAKFSILPERKEEFLKIIKEDQKLTLANETGSIQFVVGEDKESSDTFYLFEQYESEEAFQAHTKTPHYAPWDEFVKTNPWSEGGEPVAGFYNTLSEENAEERAAKKARSEPFALNAKISILAERRDEFIKIIKEDQKQTLATEPGSLRFVVGEDAKESNTFYLHEEYTSEEAFEAHGKTPHFEPWDKFTKTSPWSEGGEPVAGFFFGSHEQGKTEEVRSGHCVNAKFSILPERKKEFLKIIKEDQKLTLANETGSIQFVVGEDKESSNTFYLFEQYESEEAFQAHTKTPHYAPWDEFVKTNPWSEGGEPVAGFYNTLE